MKIKDINVYVFVINATSTEQVKRYKPNADREIYFNCIEDDLWYEYDSPISEIEVTEGATTFAVITTDNVKHDFPIDEDIKLSAYAMVRTHISDI